MGAGLHATNQTSHFVPSISETEAAEDETHANMTLVHVCHGMAVHRKTASVP